MAVVLGLAALPGPVLAQDADLPTVTLTTARGPRTQDFVRCDGSTRSLGTEPGTVALSRTGDRSGQLTVALSSSGAPVTGVDGEPLPSEITFAPGERSHAVRYLVAPPAGPDQASSFAVVAGDGYLIGEPSTGSSSPTTATLPRNCHDLERAVAVGEAPDPIDLGEYLVEPFGGPPPVVEGSAPPGLRLVADGRWEGAATAPGTDDFTAIACPFGCVELRIRVVVTDGASTTTAAPTTPATTAPPASPVRGGAAYTG